LSFTYEQAIIIGLIQGLTELFPISSLGHAILIPAWIGGSFKQFISEENDAYLLITIAMHLASSVALFLVFRKRWVGLIAGSYKAVKSKNYQSTAFHVLGYIVIATIPVGVLGLALDDYFQDIFGKPQYSALFLTVKPVILGASVVKLPELFSTDTRLVLGQIFVGSIVSFFATYVSVTFLVRWFKTKTLYPFAIYCLAFGMISMIKFV